MSTRDTMELKEETIRAQYDAALGMVLGFDHAPRLRRLWWRLRWSSGLLVSGRGPRFARRCRGWRRGGRRGRAGVRLAERLRGWGWIGFRAGGGVERRAPVAGDCAGDGGDVLGFSQDWRS